MTLEVHYTELRLRDNMSPGLARAGAAGAASARQIEQGFDRAGQATRRFSASAAAFGAGIGSATLLLGQFTRAAAEDEASQLRVEQAITNTGRSLDEYSSKLDTAIKKGQQKAFSDDETREALTRLIGVTGDAGKSIDQLGLVMDFARARGITLAASADVIGKVMGGNLGILSRYGIVLDENATKEQALALIQQRSAGQAQTYAESNLGQLDRRKDQIAELTEAWGAHAGALQSVLLLLPGITAGYSALAGIVAGAGGLAALGAVAGAFAVPLAAGLAGAAGYNMISNINRPGGTATERYLNQGMGAFGDLTGIGFLSSISQENLSLNEVEAALSAMMYVSPSLGLKGEDVNDYLLGRVTSNGFGPPSGSMDSHDVAAYMKSEAARLGMTVGQWVAFKFGASGSGYMIDPVSGKFVNQEQYGQISFDRTYAANGGQMYDPSKNAITPPMSVLNQYRDPYGGKGIYNPFQPGAYNEFGAGRPTFDAYSAGGGGAVANSLVLGGPGQYTPAQTEAISDAKIRAMLGGALAPYQGIATGQGGAQGAFAATQNILVEREAVYGGQISDFTQQQTALTEAYEILNQRKAEGQDLTKAEQDLLQNYPQLYGRISGGIEDATVQQGLLAAAYIENMQASDSMKASLEGTNGSLGDLNETLQLFILSLYGVPEEVRTAIYLDNISLALQSIESFKALLDSVPSSVATQLYITYQDYIPGGVGSPFQHGGVIPGAAHGRVMGGGVSWVGESGPELMVGGQGAMVIPASASRATKRGRGDGMQFNGPVSITVIANNPQQFGNQLREWSVGESR